MQVVIIDEMRSRRVAEHDMSASHASAETAERITFFAQCNLFLPTKKGRMFLIGIIPLYLLSLFKLDIIEAGVLFVSRSKGTRDACRGNIYRFSGLEGMFRSGHLARFPACRTRVGPESDEIADRIFQSQYLPDIEIRSRSFHGGFEGDKC